MKILLILRTADGYGVLPGPFPIWRSGGDAVDCGRQTISGALGRVGQHGAFDLDYMRHIFPILAKQVHLNTVLTAVAWAWIEPQEGKYDFHLVDAAIELANQNDLRNRLAVVRQLEERAIELRAPIWVKAN
jgi:hypothetical protein